MTPDGANIGDATQPYLTIDPSMLITRYDPEKDLIAHTMEHGKKVYTNDCLLKLSLLLLAFLAVKSEVREKKKHLQR